MNIISSRKQIPSWFSLGNYKAFDSYSMKELAMEISHRQSIISAFELYKIKRLAPELYVNHFENRAYKSITNGQPETLKVDDTGSSIILTEELKSGIDIEHVLKSRLSREQQSVWLTSTSELDSYHRRTKKYFESFEELDNEQEAITEIEFVKHFVGNALLPHDTDDTTRKGTPVTINLEDYSNNEILEALEKNLKLWRKELNISEPPKRVKPRSDEKKKIIDYRILPLIDLELWEAVEEAQIKKSVLMVTLFPDGENGEKEYYNKIKKLKDKLLADDYCLL